MAPPSFWWGSDAPEPLSGETLDPVKKTLASFYFLNHLLLEFTSVITGLLYNIVLAKQQIT